MGARDTGIELPTPPWYDVNERIIEFKDWIDEKNTQYIDLDGHGTHSAALLMKVAPYAKIYVARVFEHKNRQKSETGSNPYFEGINNGIAEAIRHAVDIWKVDIITMSFGYKRSVPKIYSAIQHAHGKAIMLAAASNEGGNEDVRWPARLSELISIHASDGKGNKTKFTADSHPNANNFSILGEDVMSSWPYHLGQGHEVRQSGTSCATSIAAGIAAIVLHFAWSYLSKNPIKFSGEDQKEFSKLGTVAGMSIVFHEMAGLRDTYNYVRPWRFMDVQGRKPYTIMDTILEDLKTKA